ncbi:MarR family winged helix-turn-helix transcriptional regulator [Amorphus sp. 3PC139-8]|uniref:MarR family winged helix-turn-helix transcriptional regulator n=1 Tax=Amorphus sp. 3PC139-8 TaxID=2735676 RepID=UPI00345D68C3
MTVPLQGPPEGAFVAGYMAYLLAQASHVYSAEIHARIKQTGCGIAEWRVLACLVDVDGLSVSRLAEMALFNQPRLSKVLDRLAAQGLIERRGDTDDRRRVRVHITPAGRAHAVPLVEIAKAHEAEMLAGYRPEEIETIKVMLRDLIRRSLASNEVSPEE